MLRHFVPSSASFSEPARLIERGIRSRAFPAAAIEVGTRDQVLWRQAFGRLTYTADATPATDDTIFDLASLTKVLATAPLVMRLVERGALGLDDPVARHLHSWQGADRQIVTIRDLLSHSSGLPAHEPFYLTLRGREAIERAIATVPLLYAPGTQSLYSDLGFILLGFILADVAALDVQFDALREQMQNPEELQFHPPEIWKRRTAPTRQSEWRGRLLRGEVDDDNAWALGGAAGHAGLFGTVGSVGSCARHVLQVLNGRVGAFQPETLRMFVTRRDDVPGSSRALGWDTMLPTSSCGTRMSPRAFGHTGFTGTSLWIDPGNDVYVALLTNRVHPDESNNAIQEIRRAVHDAVMGDVTAGD
jgi:CubicO group peptidase (beta-lactamase class C family)